MSVASAPILASTHARPRPFRHAAPALVALAALAASGALAWAIHFANVLSPDRPERAVKLVLVLFAAIPVAAGGTYVLSRRAATRPAALAAILTAVVLVELLAVYFYRVSFDVFFPADFLIWSESDYVNDIIKFRTGYPLYSDQANNESFTYVPGSQLLTYFLASLVGQGTSVPAYRVVQVLYTLAAAAFATLACRRIVAMAVPAAAAQEDRECRPGSFAWGFVAFPAFVLVATNSLTNPFTHNLHGDALAQLVNLFAYWLLVEYAARPRAALLLAMAVVPAIGFAAKQSLVIWGPFYCFYLLCFHRPLNVVRLACFAAASFALVAALVGAGYLLWGRHFFYWVFFVLGKHGVSPLRSVQHLMAGWAYFAIALAAAALLLRDVNARLWGLWTVGFLLLASETWSAGIAWMRNHMGPGCTVAAVWFVAALVVAWPRLFPRRPVPLRDPVWARTAMALCALLLLASGLSLVRIPVKPVGDAPRRYVREIERHFRGANPSDVLLDFGSWVYFDSHTVMKDRAACIGERGYSRTGDFSGILGRIRSRQYAKILVRNLHAPDFMYDHHTWDVSSGIRDAMRDHYREVETISGVSDRDEVQSRFLFADVSVLVPRSN